LELHIFAVELVSKDKAYDLKAPLPADWTRERSWQGRADKGPEQQPLAAADLWNGRLFVVARGAKLSEPMFKK
jgi:hypothetical protein